MRILTTILLIILITISLPTFSLQPLKLAPEQIEVTIKGEVEEVKTVKVAANTKLKNVMELVDLLPSADLESLDYNRGLVDNEVITILPKPEQNCISINNASVEELTILNGIGPSTAQKIIEYRTIVGPFLLLEDLMKVKSIGSKKYEKLINQICL